MKGYYLSLMFLTLTISCKEKEVSLANQLAGVYDYYEGYIPDPDKDGKFPLGNGGVTIEAIGKDLTKIRINKKSLSIWDFAECQVVEVNDKGRRTYPFYFAVIVDRKTNTEIAQVRDYFPYPNAPVSIQIEFNFADINNNRLRLISIKRKE